MGRRFWKLAAVLFSCSPTSRGTIAQVTAVDLSDKSLELAKQQAEVYGLQE